MIDNIDIAILCNDATNYKNYDLCAVKPPTSGGGYKAQ